MSKFLGHWQGASGHRVDPMIFLRIDSVRMADGAARRSDKMCAAIRNLCFGQQR